MISDFLKMPFIMFRRAYRTLWVRVTLYALVSVLAAASGSVAELFLDDRFTDMVPRDAVMPVLTILASSMLAVSTFSLNVMVSAHRSAAQNATPRVHRLLLEDTTTQAVLATFVGAFVFALTSIVLFQIGFYQDSAATVTMIVAVGVVVMVIIAILRWINHLSKLGSIDQSLRTVIKEACEGVVRLAEVPALGGVPLTQEIDLPDHVTDIVARESGYVQLVDVAGLQSCLSGTASVYVKCGPGKHVLKGQMIAQVSEQVSPETLRDLSANFVIGERRSFEQDPVFGLHVMSEIASKALSPGVNDAGTAIETIGGLKEVLWAFDQAKEREDAVQYDQVFVPVPDVRKLYEAAFEAIARDGAGQIEVAISLRVALAELAHLGSVACSDAATHVAQVGMEYAEAALPLEREIKKLRAIKV